MQSTCAWLIAGYALTVANGEKISTAAAAEMKRMWSCDGLTTQQFGTAEVGHCSTARTVTVDVEALMQTTYPDRTIVFAVVPRTMVNTIALMFGFALLTALAAQIRIPVPGTPVPITGQTFAVLLAGASLGSRLGAGSQAIYWVLGAIGLPFYTNATGGWEAATGTTAGYLVGFVVAAWAVGALAERGQDRTVSSAIPAFLTGNAIIYLFGVPWLMFSVEAIDSITAALVAGFTPFVVGDLIKVVLAGLFLPAAWRLVDHIQGSS